jgi:hypothetical protein
MRKPELVTAIFLSWAAAVTFAQAPARIQGTDGTTVTVMAGKDANGNGVANRVMIGSMMGR